MRARRVVTWLGAVIAAVVVLVAVAVSIFRIVIPQVPEYRHEVSLWAGDLLGAPVDIGGLDVRWRRLRPELILAQVRFVSADALHAFAAREVRVGVSVQALLRGQVAPARIVVVEPDFTLDFKGFETEDGAGWRRAFAAREHRGEVQVVNGRVTLLAESGRRRVDLEGVDALLSSDGSEHRLTATASPAGGAGGTMRAALRARGWPGERNWRAGGRVALQGTDLVALQELGRRGRLRSGTVDAVAEIELGGPVAQRVSVDVGLSSLRWPAADGTEHRIERAAGEFTWRSRADGWEASLQRLVVARRDGVRESGPAALRFAGSGGSGKWALDIDDLHLEDVAVFGEALPWEPLPGGDDWLRRSPRGTVIRGALALERGAEMATRYTVQADAEGLGLDAADGVGIPGFAEVALKVDGDDAGGEVEVRVAGGFIHFPTVFRAPTVLDHAAADLAWAPSASGWALDIFRLDIDTPDVRVRGGGELALAPPGGEHAMHLDAEFSDVSLAAHPAYLPVSVMSDNLVDWLDRAVTAGRAPAGSFSYRGPLTAAALADGRATMEVEFAAEDIALEFADGWPAFHDGRARITFTGTGFRAVVGDGTLSRAAVGPTLVTIDRFAEPVLVIDGGSTGPLSRMLDAFRATPLGRASWLAGTAASGDARLALRVEMPLHGDDDTRVTGDLTLDGATLGFGGFPHPLSGVHGTLQLVDDAVSATGVRGRLLGADVQVGVTTLRDGDGTARAVEVSLAGDADRTMLAALFEHPRPPVAGTTRWEARLFAPYAAGEAPYLEIDSTLEGMALDLPAPLGKPAGTRRPVAVRAELLDGQRRFTLDGGDALQARGTFIADDGRWRFAAGRVHVGDGEPPPPQPTGVALTGRLESWTQGVGDGIPALGAELPFSEIDLEIGVLEAYGRVLDDVAVHGRRRDAAWEWSLAGSRVAGTLSVPDAPTNATPVRADFTRLALPSREPGERDAASYAEVSARAVPPLVLHAADLTIGAVALGEVNGTVVQVENGIAVEEFTATQRDLRITGAGSWHTVDGYHRTTLRAAVESTDVRRALAALGYAASVEAQAGHLQVDVNWLDSPFANPLPLASGAVQVRIERGVLHELEPGAGRVFGLLSLNTLPRRLALDFSDVYRRGLAFDSITGSFALTTGQAHTDDLRLQGPAARIDIRGRTGLATRDYDQEAVVVGSLASSLAIAGTLAGGPGVGAAMLIASELLRGPLEGMARVRYHVTGPWEDPVVERVEQVRASP